MKTFFLKKFISKLNIILFQIRIKLYQKILFFILKKILFQLSNDIEKIFNFYIK